MPRTLPPYICIAALLLLVADAKTLQLRFGRDGTFKIVQFTDLHYGEDPRLDELSNHVQSTVLEQESPSLVLFSGDMVSGQRWDGSRDWYNSRWQQLASPVRSSGLRHAAILGNHDGEGDLGRRQIMALAGRDNNVSISQTDPAGTSYYIDLYDPDGLGIAARIWMLDSNDRGCGPLRAGWGCVTSNTLAWVRHTAEELPVVPSLAFIHIPLQEFRTMWNRHNTSGTKGEPVGCPLINTRAFDILREVGVRAIYSGHDHDNDYIGTMHGVRLAYGRKTGYGNYGPLPGTLHGARVIQLRQGESYSASKTWIRQEDGSRVDQAPSEPGAKVDTQQHTCISDLGVLGWVGWSTRTARLAAAGTVAGVALLAVLAGLVVMCIAQRRGAAGRRERELELSSQCLEPSPSIQQPLQAGQGLVQGSGAGRLHHHRSPNSKQA